MSVKVNQYDTIYGSASSSFRLNAAERDTDTDMDDIAPAGTKFAVTDIQGSFRGCGKVCKTFNWKIQTTLRTKANRYRYLGNS